MNMIDPITHGSMGTAQRVSSSLSVDPHWSMRTAQVDTQFNSLKLQGATETREQLIQAGQEFEAYFISYLLKVMRETVPEGALANKQGDYFYSFYDQEIGTRAAQSGGIGIAKMVQEYAEKYVPVSSAEGSSSSG